MLTKVGRDKHTSLVGCRIGDTNKKCSIILISKYIVKKIFQNFEYFLYKKYSFFPKYFQKCSQNFSAPVDNVIKLFTAVSYNFS
jgi:hypothetical protein